MAPARNAQAIALMVFSMALFALEDALIKIIATGLGAGQIIFLQAFVGFVIFGAISRWRGEAWRRDILLDKVVLLRNGAEIFMVLTFVSALTLMPLSNASAILQVQPLMVTLGAALFLGETVGWRRWTAVAIGFFGVLLIIRPGMEGFNAASLLALAGAIGLAARDLSTRALKQGIPTFLANAWASLFVCIGGAALQTFAGGWTMPNADEIRLLVYATGLGLVAYTAITIGLRIGETAAVAPFRYSRLVFAMIIGAILFGERPDALTYVGSALVIATGVYTLWRERRRRAEALRIAATAATAR